MLKEKTIIFTDLDGTLLDHTTYSFEAAVPMLDFIKRNKIPLIIVTSKTKDEVLRIQKLLALKEPFIVENGAGIFIPSKEGYEMISMGFDSGYIQRRYHFTLRYVTDYANDVGMRAHDDVTRQRAYNVIF